VNHAPRTVARIVLPVLVTEGAGVRLRRTIASGELDYLDPFLLLDDFRSDSVDDFIAGFPMHPHRGIETVTYMLDGAVKHRDSLGNSGVIGPGDVQWMTAGGGIMHEEMPGAHGGRVGGFQLWVNLPARLKMTRPRYQEVPAASIPDIHSPTGTRIRLITGQTDGVRGPVTDIAADPIYMDVSIPPQQSFVQPIMPGHTAFAYVFEGEGTFGVDASGRGTAVDQTALLVLADGDHLTVHTGKHHTRFLLVSGKPLGEPIARYGPFVMNTREEIQQALKDLREGTFVQ